MIFSPSDGDNRNWRKEFIEWKILEKNIISIVALKKKRLNQRKKQIKIKIKTDP
jgi:hypothetical protein